MDIPAISFGKTDSNHSEKDATITGIVQRQIRYYSCLFPEHRYIPFTILLDLKKTAFCVASTAPFTLSSRHSFTQQIKLHNQKPVYELFSIRITKI